MICKDVALKGVNYVVLGIDHIHFLHDFMANCVVGGNYAFLFVGAFFFFFPGTV